MPPDVDGKLAFLIKNCYECFIQRDCFEITLNPLIWTKCHKFRAANPQIRIDNNSLYRQSELLSLHDNQQVEPLERIAGLHDLVYTKINGDEGNIGIITNGHGLSLATADMIHLLHGFAANYLNFSGGSSIEDMLYSLDLMEYDKRVKVVLINIFGGMLDI